MGKVVTSTIYADPSADGSKSDWTAFGAATDWQAVSKGVRQPTVPSAASGIRSTDSGNIERFNFTVPTPSAGQYINWVRVWAYYSAVPANHTTTQSVSSLSGGKKSGASVASTGWQVSKKYTPFPSPGTQIIEPGDTATVQLQLTEGAAQAANTEITAVYLEFGCSSMEHVIPSGSQFVGSVSGRPYTFSHAGYVSVAFDGWMAGDDPEGMRTHLRRMAERGLDLVRIFVPFGDMMDNATTVNAANWEDFGDFLEVCREEGVRLVVTGLVHFLDDQRPVWLDGLTKDNRYATYRTWWDACAAEACSSPAVVAYDLINESFAGDGLSSWYFGGPPFDWATALCLNLDGLTPADHASIFVTNMRDISGDGIEPYDKTKPYSLSEGIDGPDTATIKRLPHDDVSTVSMPHIYVFDKATGAHSPQVGLAELDEHLASGLPVIVEEAGNLGEEYTTNIFIDWAFQAIERGAVAVSGGWPGVFSSFLIESSFKIHMMLTPLVQGRIVKSGRVGRAEALSGRAGQRSR